MSQMRRSVKGSEGNWVEMQKDTFTNWVNANLRTRGMEIEELETGFEDGVKLVNLFEVVSKKRVGKYAKNPKFPNQKMENVSLVLKAMENDGVKLVSIDSDHVVNGNFKMILGLIWQLILRYQIGGTEDKSVKIALKKLLLIWLQHVIPNQKISNLTSDWNSGIALSNLVNVMQPGLCSEYMHMNRSTPVENAAQGMRLAEEYFGIPQIISPEHMASPNVDELSMMTYLSYFTQDNGVGEQWTLSQVNQWNGDHHVTNFNTDWNDGTALGKLVEAALLGSMPDLRADDDAQNCGLGMNIAEKRLGIDQIITPQEMANPNIPELAIMAYAVQFSKVEHIVNLADQFEAYGPGIIEPQVGVVNEFYVRCADDYPLNDLKVEVIGPNNRTISVLYEDTSPELRTYRYKVEEPGMHTINTTYQGHPIQKSPTHVNANQDLTMIRVHGDGLGGACVNNTSEFTVDIGTKTSQLNANVEGPSGFKTPATIINNNDGTYTVRYTPSVIGNHKIALTINNQQLPGGPIEIQVTDPNAVEVSTMQYDEDKQLYAELYERIGIAVDTRHSGEGSLSAQTIGPKGNEASTDVENESEGNFTVSFTPTEIGEYHTNVYWNKKPIQGSPFIVWVSDPHKCVASGEALQQARVYEKSQFDVSTIGSGPGKLTAYTEHNGHHQTVEIQHRGDDTYTCIFIPSEVGDYFLHINYNNVPIRGSPFKVRVGNPKEAVVVVTETVVETSQPHSFAVNLSDAAGQGDLKCTVIGPYGRPLGKPCEIKQVSEKTREISFVPQDEGRHEINIYFAGALLSGCPYIVNVVKPSPHIPVDASRVIVDGIGMQEGTVNELCRVHVDARDAGPGHLSATVQGVKHDVVVGIRDNNNSTYEVTYTPPTPGAYALDIKWDREHVKGSPFKITVQPRSEPDSVMVNGEGIKEGTAGQPIKFTLDGRKAGPGQLSCRCRAPSGKMTYVLISDNKDGTYTVDLNATEPGLHTVEVEWDGKPIPGSPFLVRIMQAPDSKKVQAFGPGLESGLLSTFQGAFQVDSKGAGPGTLKIRIHGPKGAFKVEMFRDHPKDRIINVRYNPTEPGIYTANVLWTDEQVMGSPFEIFVAENEEHLQKWRQNREQIQGQEALNGY